MLRKNPKRITFLAPIVTYFFTFCEGTGHCSYAILPAIAEIARGAGIRPERPMSIAVIASQQAVTASPIAAATASLLSIISGANVSLIQIILCSFPATFVACMIGALIMSRYGKELNVDPEYQFRLKLGMVEPPTGKEEADNFEPAPCAKGSVAIFLVFFAIILLVGVVDAIRPSWTDATGNTTYLSMIAAVEMLMLLCSAIIIIYMVIKLGKESVQKITKGSVWEAGTGAVVAIFGVAWMGDTFFQANKEFITNSIANVVSEMPWLFAIALFALSILLFSQAATVRTLMPLGVSLGIPAPLLVGMFPAVNGYFFIPNYPTCVAAINFDRTGTTHIGKYVLNHSFMLPGMVVTSLSVIFGIGLSCIFIGF